MALAGYRIAAAASGLERHIATGAEVKMSVIDCTLRTRNGGRHIREFHPIESREVGHCSVFTAMPHNGTILITGDIEGAGPLDPQRGEVAHVDAAITGAGHVDDCAAGGHQLILASRLITDDAAL